MSTILKTSLNADLGRYIDIATVNNSTKIVISQYLLLAVPKLFMCNITNYKAT